MPAFVIYVILFFHELKSNFVNISHSSKTHLQIFCSEYWWNVHKSDQKFANILHLQLCQTCPAWCASNSVLWCTYFPPHWKYAKQATVIFRVCNICVITSLCNINWKACKLALPCSAKLIQQRGMEWAGQIPSSRETGSYDSCHLLGYSAM
jgi:hypothetical protein